MFVSTYQERSYIINRSLVVKCLKQKQNRWFVLLDPFASCDTPRLWTFVCCSVVRAEMFISPSNFKTAETKEPEGESINEDFKMKCSEEGNINKPSSSNSTVRSQVESQFHSQTTMYRPWTNPKSLQKHVNQNHFEQPKSPNP